MKSNCVSSKNCFWRRCAKNFSYISNENTFVRLTRRIKPNVYKCLSSKVYFYIVQVIRKGSQFLKRSEYYQMYLIIIDRSLLKSDHFILAAACFGLHNLNICSIITKYSIYEPDSPYMNIFVGCVARIPKVRILCRSINELIRNHQVVNHCVIRIVSRALTAWGLVLRSKSQSPNILRIKLIIYLIYSWGPLTTSSWRWSCIDSHTKINICAAIAFILLDYQRWKLSVPTSQFGRETNCFGTFNRKVNPHSYWKTTVIAISVCCGSGRLICTS